MAKTTALDPDATKGSGKGNGEKKPDFDRTLFSRYAELLDKDLKKKCKAETDLFFGYTENTITIFDQFPKAIFHFLVLPRVKAPPLTKTNLKSLRSLFSRNVPKDVARQVIQEIAKDAYAVRDQIRKEMMDRYRFTWDIHLGFHAIQSMEYVSKEFVSSLTSTQFPSLLQSHPSSRNFKRFLRARIEDKEAHQLFHSQSRGGVLLETG